MTLGEDGRPRFLVKIQAEADISAISGGRTRFESGAYGKLEACVGEELQRQAEDAIRTAVLKNSCDIFGFGNLLYQKYPSFWKGLDWEKADGGMQLWFRWRQRFSGLRRKPLMCWAEKETPKASDKCRNEAASSLPE